MNSIDRIGRSLVPTNIRQKATCCSLADLANKMVILFHFLTICKTAANEFYFLNLLKFFELFLANVPTFITF